MKLTFIKYASLILASTTLLWSSLSLAGGTEYDMRVDGLACPFCAYGIEKKFTKTEGVKSVDVNLKKGLVIVKTVDGKTFTKDELKTIVNDSGFTMKNVTVKEY